MLMYAVDNTGDPARRMDRLDITFDDLPKLLGDCLGSDTQGKRLCRIQVGEYAGEDGSKRRVQFLLRVHAMGMLFRLQGERENLGCKMDRRKIAHASEISIKDIPVNMDTYSLVMST